MGKILGVDFGEVRTGLAITDQLHIIASPYKTLKPKNLDQLIYELKNIIELEKVEKIVVGLPIGTSGKDTKRTKITRKFIKKLKSSIDQSVETMDERYSSNEAKRILIKQGVRTGHSKERVDQTAAAIILRRYLDDQTNNYK